MAGEMDLFAGKWNEVKGNLRTWWGKLTNDDIEEIKGNRDRLLGKLEQRYGWTRMQAEEEINRRLMEYERQNPSTMKR